MTGAFSLESDAKIRIVFQLRKRKCEFFKLFFETKGENKQKCEKIAEHRIFATFCLPNYYAFATFRAEGSQGADSRHRPEFAL